MLLIIFTVVAICCAIYLLSIAISTIDREIENSRQWLIAFKKSQQESEDKFDAQMNDALRSLNKKSSIDLDWATQNAEDCSSREEISLTANRPIRSAGIMLIVKDGLILGISRRDNRSIFGLLGGKNEDEEDLKQTAIRETLEEAGIAVSSCVLFHQRLEPGIKDGIDYQCQYYYATKWEAYWDEPCSPEGMKLKWLTLKEITETQTAFPDTIKDVFEVFQQKFPEIELK